MFKQFINLQWKAFFRSASFGKSVGIKVFMIFMGLYLLGSLAFLGSFLYTILRKVVPTQGPMWVLSQFLIYWVLIELIFRYFMQKLPVLDIKPLLINNIPKSKIWGDCKGRLKAEVWFTGQRNSPGSTSLLKVVLKYAKKVSGPNSH